MVHFGSMLQLSINFDSALWTDVHHLQADFVGFGTLGLLMHDEPDDLIVVPSAGFAWVFIDFFNRDDLMF